jgi:hypothetical protein
VLIYSPSQSKSEALQRRLHISKRRPGCKAVELAALLRAEKEQTPTAVEDEFEWDGPAQAIYTLQETAIEEVLPSAPTAVNTTHTEDTLFTPSSAEASEPSLPMALKVVQASAIDAAIEIEPGLARAV